MKIILFVCATAILICITASHASFVDATPAPAKSATAPIKAKKPAIVMWEGWSTGDGFYTDISDQQLTLAEAQVMEKPGLTPEDTLILRRTYPIPLDVYYIPALAKSGKNNGKRSTVLVAYGIDEKTGKVANISIGREGEFWNVKDVTAGEVPFLPLPNRSERDEWEYHGDATKDEMMCIPTESKP